MTYSIAGKRRTQAFRTKEAAQAKAAEIAGDVHNQKAAAKTLSWKDLDGYLYSVNALAPFGLPLSSAIHEYVAVRKKLRGVSINEAAEFYCRHNLIGLPQKTVAEVAEEMLEAKRCDGASKEYLRDLRNRLRRITSELSGPLFQVTRQQIEEWLRSLRVSPRTRNNFRTVIVTLWRFAKQCGYLPRDRSTEADSLSRAKAVDSEIEIFRPEELAKLLGRANPELVPFLAIGAFTGLRHAELLRLEWKDVRFAQAFVEVTAKKSKTAQRRLVPIQDNLALWLAPYKGRIGKVRPWDRVGRRLSVLAKELGIRWPNNGLRHSFASYRLAQCQDAAKVALEMGNSPAMIFRHYRELVVPQDAAAWFSIEPKPAANVVPMSKHKASA
ncbi:MAG: tyrosine-type recombinase/integrase [Verrucomicrobia bacterium]|nr:tyrosine-type recombinase/integrase [Verrucomicrobiota bacterium]